MKQSNSDTTEYQILLMTNPFPTQQIATAKNFRQAIIRYIDIALFLGFQFRFDTRNKNQRIVCRKEDMALILEQVN